MNANAEFEARKRAFVEAEARKAQAAERLSTLYRMAAGAVAVALAAALVLAAVLKKARGKAALESFRAEAAAITAPSWEREEDAARAKDHAILARGFVETGNRERALGCFDLMRGHVRGEALRDLVAQARAAFLGGDEERALRRISDFLEALN